MSYPPQGAGAAGAIAQRIEEEAAVYYDAGGVAGTAFPIGTPQFPVNNEADLLTIIARTGSRKVVLLSDFTANNTYNDITWVCGGAKRQYEFDISVEDVGRCEFVDLIVDGAMVDPSDPITCRGCLIQWWPSNWHGRFYDCELADADGLDLLMTGTGEFYDCIFGRDFWIEYGQVILHNCLVQDVLILYALGNYEHRVNLSGGTIHFQGCQGSCEVTGWGGIINENDGYGLDVLDYRNRAAVQVIRPTWSFVENWSDEAGIPAADWTKTDPATGVAWARVARGGWFVASAAPNADETARLVSTFRIPVQGDGAYAVSKNTLWKRLVVEWEMELDGVANVDNALFFVGLSENPAADRTTDNLFGIILVSDGYRCLGDNGGAEADAIWPGLPVVTPGNRNKFRLEINDESTGACIVNEYFKRLFSSANIPLCPAYFNIFIDTEGGGPAQFYIGPVRMWLHDYNRTGGG